MKICNINSDVTFYFTELLMIYGSNSPTYKWWWPSQIQFKLPYIWSLHGVLHMKGIYTDVPLEWVDCFHDWVAISSGTTVPSFTLYNRSPPPPPWFGATKIPLVSCKLWNINYKSIRWQWISEMIFSCSQYKTHTKLFCCQTSNRIVTNKQKISSSGKISIKSTLFY